MGEEAGVTHRQAVTGRSYTFIEQFLKLLLEFLKANKKSEKVWTSLSHILQSREGLCLI
jgi:hypothetical protein